VSSISYSDGTPTKNFLYDVSAGWGETQSNLKGRLSKALVPALGNEEGDIFSYDQMGRIVFTGQCFAYGCGNGADDKYINDVYDWVGNLTSQYDPTAGVIDYTYNPANQLLSATNQTYTDTTNPPDLISNVQNGPNGPISYLQGNGLGDYRAYDALGRLYGKWVCQGTSPSLECETGNEPQLYGTGLSWSGTEVTGNCDTAIGTCRIFGYDEFGRLKSQSVNSQTQYSYVYDRYGNRWQQNAAQGGPSPSVAFTKSTNQIIGDSYDAAGNMLSDGIHTYTFDAEGNVIAADGGNTSTYTYDALNHRVRIQSPYGTADFTFDAFGRRLGGWVESTNAAIGGNECWGSSAMRIAYRSSNATIFDEQDWLDTERAQTSAAGAVIGSYTSLPFGDGYAATGEDNDADHFAELQRDGETDTHNAQFRQYSSSMGRWMSPDPYDGSYDWSDPQSYNRYAYVGNNPLGGTDPSGRIACAATAGIILVTGGPAGPEGAAIACGIEYGAAAAISIFKLLGLFGPSFHGTLAPRPSGGQPWSEIVLPNNPNIAGALGLPDDTCDFGPCGGVINNFNNGAQLSTISSPILDNFRLASVALSAFDIFKSFYHAHLQLIDCAGAPDQVSDIGDLRHGILYPQSQGSSEGSYGKGITHNTTQGYRTYGNEDSDTRFGGADQAVSYLESYFSCIENLNTH
jgi:RHS repeat-associated protein